MIPLMMHAQTKPCDGSFVKRHGRINLTGEQSPQVLQSTKQPYRLDRIEGDQKGTRSRRACFGTMGVIHLICWMTLGRV